MAEINESITFLSSFDCNCVVKMVFQQPVVSHQQLKGLHEILVARITLLGLGKLTRELLLGVPPVQVYGF